MHIFNAVREMFVGLIFLFLLTISRIDVKYRVFIRDFLARDRLYLTRRSKSAENFLRGITVEIYKREAFMQCTFRKVLSRYIGLKCYALLM